MVSLLAEMSCFPLMWDARLRWVVFWFKILLPCLKTVLFVEQLKMPSPCPGGRG